MRCRVYAAVRTYLNPNGVETGGERFREILEQSRQRRVQDERQGKVERDRTSCQQLIRQNAILRTGASSWRRVRSEFKLERKSLERHGRNEREVENESLSVTRARSNMQGD